MDHDFGDECHKLLSERVSRAAEPHPEAWRLLLLILNITEQTNLGVFIGMSGS